MSDTLQLRITSESADHTEALGESLGKRLRGGEVIELVSDLGGGKTTLVRGLARGAGSHDHVSSPTFTMSKIYETGDFQLHHYDFYRLDQAGILAEELSEVIEDGRNVTIIEWSDIVKQVLPATRLTITIDQTAEDERQIIIEVPVAYSYLLQAAP
jgi:tRNA threonylcarbamoyladenosine biosynthesis protein TsaE